MRFKHFSLSEFNCTCSCDTGRINPLLVALLDKIRMQIKMPIKVTSGIRCRFKNSQVSGHRGSQHVPDVRDVAHAADISCGDLDALYDLCVENFMALGDGRSRGFVHVDMRPDRIRRWKY